MSQILSPMLGWLPVIAIVLLAWGFTAIQNMRRTRDPFEGIKRPEKEKDSHPAEASKHEDPHHPKKGGGDHGHGRHAEKKSPWYVQMLWLIGILVVGTVAFRFIIIPTFASWGFGQVPGASREHREELNRTHGLTTDMGTVETTSFDMSACPATPENITVIAPPRGAALAAEFPIPMCYTAKLCDKARDPQCTAQEFSDTRLSVRCESAGDEPVTREFDRERDLASQTCWVQSTGPEKIVVDVIYRIKDNL